MIFTSNLSTTMRNAFVLGGTGMVGRHLTKELLANDKYSTVTLLSRRELRENELSEWPNKNKLIVKVVDFDHLENSKEVFDGKDIGFSCLGTTRRDAGSAEAFIKIDYHYTYDSAVLFKKALDAKGMKGDIQIVTAGGSKFHNH